MEVHHLAERNNIIIASKERCEESSSLSLLEFETRTTRTARRGLRLCRTDSSIPESDHKPTEPSIMRDRRSSCSDYVSSTGPDRYFDESLQYPTLGKHSKSHSFSFVLDRKSIMIPSSFPAEQQQRNIRFLSITKPSPVAFEPYESRHPVSKSLRECPPTDSPGSSQGTINTSPCTDSDNDDEDLDSLCGSLTYSVESFAAGQIFEDIDEGYHAEDEHTAADHFSRSCSSLYDDHEGDDEGVCFAGHNCSFVFDGIHDWLRATLRSISGEDFEVTTPRDRRKLMFRDDHRL